MDVIQKDESNIAGREYAQAKCAHQPPASEESHHQPSESYWCLPLPAVGHEPWVGW